MLPLLKDTDPNVIVAALEALGNIGSIVAIVPIVDTYAQYPFARIVAIEALGKIGGDSVRYFLENKIREALAVGNADGVYLFALLDAIGIVGNGESLVILLANYEYFRDHLRDVFLHEVVQIIERSNLEFLFKNEVRGDLLHALGSDNQLIQLSAAKGLVQFKDRDVTRALLLSLGISEEMDFVVIAQMSSSRPSVFQVALECLEKGMTRGKIQVIMLLGKLATEFIHSYKKYRAYPIDQTELKRTFTVIEEAWQDASEEDRELIADTLFRFDCDGAADFLNEALLELDPWSRVHIIDQLSTMPTQRAFDCIARFVRDENEMVREAALSALRAAGLPVEIDTRITGEEPLDKGIDDGV